MLAFARSHSGFVFPSIQASGLFVIPVLATQTSASGARHVSARPHFQSLAASQAEPRPSQYADVPEPRRRLLLGVVLLAHLIGAWTLWQGVGSRSPASKPEPIVLSLIAPPPPAPRQPMQNNGNRPPAAPPIALAATPSAPLTPSAQPAQLTGAIITAAEAAPQVTALTPAPAPATTQAATPAPASGPRQIAPNAARYLVEPQMTVPLLSRRLGESGVVHLRIVVDTHGHLKEVSLKKSAGFARLDQQALADIRSARFAPYIENGQPVEWETVALLSYEIDR